MHSAAESARLLEAVRADRLELIVMPTEQCNLRCVYCYEDFAVGRMSEPTQRGLIALMRARASSLRRLHLSWFGGEPLLARDVVLRLLREARALERRHAPLRVTSEMTTNGVLLDAALARELFELGVNDYQLSLDGPEALHDRWRIDRRGRGSYASVLRGIRALAAVEGALRVKLRIHVQRENLEHLDGLLDTLRAEIGDDPRFVVFFRAVGAWGGDNDDRLPLVEPARVPAILAGLRARAEELGLRSFEVEEGSSCYAARANSFLIRADGRVGKCTVALSAPANSLGWLTEDGELRLRSGALDPWMRGWIDGDEAALRCPNAGLENHAVG